MEYSLKNIEPDVECFESSFLC